MALGQRPSHPLNPRYECLDSLGCHESAANPRVAALVLKVFPHSKDFNGVQW